MCLKIAQDNLKQLIGGEYYEQLETQYNSNTLSIDNDALYDPYIKDYLAWQTYLNYMGVANSDSTPTGEREFIDENSSVLSEVKMYSKQKYINKMLNFYRGEMIRFLKEAKERDSTKYPLWSEKCDYGFSFGVTSITKTNYDLFKVNKSMTNNE